MWRYVLIISVVILAAGESTRFPGGKLLQKIVFKNTVKPLLRILVDKYILNKHVSEVVVVVGYRFDEIIRSLGNSNIKYVYNRMFSEGMSSSVKVGVSSVAKYSDIVFIHPGDVPFVKEETIGKLVSKSIELYGHGRDFIIIPRYRGKGGHPLVVSRKLIKHVLEIREEEQGLKGFLRKYSSNQIYIDVDDPGVLYDIDTPEDLVRAEEMFKIKWVRQDP